MQRTDDPIADYDRYCEEVDRMQKELPQCECCGERITETKAVCIEGRWFCEDCEDEAWELVRDDYLKETH